MSIDVNKFIEQAEYIGVYWDCPYCKKGSKITNEDIAKAIKLGEEGRKTSILTIICPNPECKKETVYLAFYTGAYGTPRFSNSYEMIQSEMLYPHGIYNHYPDYVPEPIRKDYEEAASISQLSPKASAALIRRALQGMIKDKWPVLKDKYLNEQINSLDDKVPAHQKEALHGIRKIGNVGAHMNDPGVIADQDSPITVDDADNLIKLLEYLIKTWYVDEADAMALMYGISNRGDEVDNIQKGKNKK